MDKNTKGLLVNILREADNCDCTLLGVSSFVHGRRELFLIGPGIDGYLTVEEAEKTNRPVLRVENYKGQLRAVPIETPPRGSWSFGGNFVFSSDSRFSAAFKGHATGRYPIPIHDRNEATDGNIGYHD